MYPTFLPVNWIDGMKINKSHFIAQNNAYTFQFAQGISAMINEYNYGILPNRTIGGGELKIHVVLGNQQELQIRIQKCRAITFAGHYIQFSEESFLNNSCLYTRLPGLEISLNDLNENTSSYFLVLMIDPYKRQPFGMAIPDELPPRLPYSIPSYTLQLMSAQDACKHLLGGFHLPIGKLIFQENNILFDKDYIPPCCSISSHASLLATHAEVEVFFGKMECFSLQIIQKILQKKQQNEMTMILQKLCEQITFFTSSTLTSLSLVSIDQPPVFLLNTLASFARLIKNTLDGFNGTGKEELINYCTEWCEIDNGELETAIFSLVNYKYDHLNIHDSIELVIKFMQLITQLFTRLTQLEYIGKRKDIGIFVKEQIITSERQESSGKRTSFLAE
jgi:hypothetical protein